MKLNLLILDDEKTIRDELEDFFKGKEFNVFKAALPSEALKILQANPIDIAIVDIRLPEMDGIEVLKKIKEHNQEIEVFMISGHSDMENVIKSMRLGASDFFQKPFRLIEVQKTIERTQKYIHLVDLLKQTEYKNYLLSHELEENTGKTIIYKSHKMDQVIDLMAKVAKSDTTVLITGESGTGKELIARGIHYLSNRNDQYFYSVNCSAITDTLFESEFFGHTKGAFTGAIDNKPGWFEVANNGFLFLDEIGDFPLNLQAKLLRVLEEKKVYRVGSHKEFDVDVRIVAATNQDLNKLCDEKKFRLDILHRISAFSIQVPPLRERTEDIEPLLSHFIKSFSKKMGKKIHGFEPNVIDYLSQYHFPGNVRELRNMIERALIICEGNKLQCKHFQYNSTNNVILSKNSGFDIFDLKNLEKNVIKKALEKTGFNKSKTASLLNITRQSLNRRIEKFNIQS